MTYSSLQAARLAGCSYRVAYYLGSRVIHLVQPGNGSGSRMRWDESDVAVLSVFAALRQFGATDSTLRPLEENLRTLPPSEWTDTYVVSRDGTLTPADDAGAPEAGWLIDLDQLPRTRRPVAA